MGSPSTTLWRMLLLRFLGFLGLTLLEQQKKSNGFVGAWSSSPMTTRGHRAWAMTRLATNGGGDNDGSSNNNNNNNNEPLFYDDFGDDNNLDPSSSSSLSSLTPTLLLQQRMQQVKAQETWVQEQTLKNWQRGNWHVRGFTLQDDVDLSSSSSTDDAATGGRELRQGQPNSRNKELPSSWPNDNNMQSPPPQSTRVVPANNNNKQVSIATCALQVVTDDDDDDDDDNNDDDNDVVLWLGRSDGSLVAVQYSDTEALARFATQLVPGTTTDGQFTVQPGFVKQVVVPSSPAPVANNDDDGDDNNDDWPNEVEEEDNDVDNNVIVTDPFAIVAQALQTVPSAPISYILPLSTSLILSSSATETGDIQPWRMPARPSDNDDNDESSATTGAFLTKEAQAWTGVHSKPLVLLERVPNHSSDDRVLVCSVSTDGTLAVWTTNGTCKVRHQLLVDDDDDDDMWRVSAAQVTDKHLLVGTTQGHVHLWTWSQILDVQSLVGPSPVGTIVVAKDETAVTALAACTEDNGDMYVAAGTARGSVKQWQLLRVGDSSDDRLLQAWPKLETQRLKHKAHVLKQPPPPPPSSDDDDDDDEKAAIVQLHYVQQGAWLVAATSETMDCWSTAAGSSRPTTTTTSAASMRGFEDLTSVLVVPGRTALVTNGLQQVVAIHDYAAAAEEILNDKDDDDDDDWDVLGYLERTE